MADSRNGNRGSSIFSDSDRDRDWNRGGGERWRGTVEGGGQEFRTSGGGYRPQPASSGTSGSQGDRGLFDRAGDEVRSWFGDEEAERRREMDARRYEQEHGQSGRYSGGGHEDQWRGGRPDQQGGQYARGQMRSNGGQSGYGGPSYERGGYGQTGSGQGGGQGWQSGQAGQGSWSGESYGQSGGQQGGFGQSSQARGGQGRQGGQGLGQSGQSFGQSGSGAGGSHHDESYRRWREQQIAELDREYEEYCRHRQQQFEQEFSSFRQNRQGSITSGGPTMGRSDQGPNMKGSTEFASSSGATGGQGASTGQTAGPITRPETAGATTTGAGTASAATSSTGSSGEAATGGSGGGRGSKSR